MCSPRLVLTPSPLPHSEIYRLLRGQHSPAHAARCVLLRLQEDDSLPLPGQLCRTVGREMSTASPSTPVPHLHQFPLNISVPLLSRFPALAAPLPSPSFLLLSLCLCHFEFFLFVCFLIHWCLPGPHFPPPEKGWGR